MRHKIIKMNIKPWYSDIKSDLPASLVVFFVAVPLCLGIALASGAPLFSGIIAGIVGGIITGLASGSALGVSGPAAGLAVIVFSSIQSLGGSYNAFLLAVVIAGIIQLILGYVKAGFIGYFFPSSVIKGMLTGIGLLIILKQIPHALGWDKDDEGDFEFFQRDGKNTFSEIVQALEFITPSALIVSLVSLSVLILWDKVLSKKHKIFGILNGPLVVVVMGILLSYLTKSGILGLHFDADQLVRLPVPGSFTDFMNQFTIPDFSMISNVLVWKVAFVLAIVASLETLLSVEATDKLDPEKRITPTNRELKAQGLGNLISGMIGGLPITQVIVRSSANINFGAKTKTSAIIHGIMLLISAITIAPLLNLIPLSSLAAVLLLVGYKLAKPSLFKEMYKLGPEQFVPFIVTIVTIIFTDLLIGITAGMVMGGFYALLQSYRNSHNFKESVSMEGDREVHYFKLAEEVSFFNKANVMKELNKIHEGSKVILDMSGSIAIAYDVIELIEDFEQNAKLRNIIVEKIINPSLKIY